MHDRQLCLVKSELIAPCSENTATSQSGRRHSLFSVRIPCSGVLGMLGVLGVLQMMQKMLTPLCACSFSVSLSVNLGKVSVAAGKNGDLCWSPVDALRGLVPRLWGSEEGTLALCANVQMAIGHTGKSDVFPTLDFMAPTFSS